MLAPAQINYRMLVTLQDTRQLSGQLLAFDRHMNLVLADTHEFRQVKRKQQGNQQQQSATATVVQEEKRTLGLIILRGTQVMSLSVESPPPSDPAARLGKTTPGGISSTLLAAGPGVARPAGRGAPAAPVSLAGPAAGVGGAFPGFPGQPGGAPGPPGFPGRPGRESPHPTWLQTRS